jgi:hypothetical protein
LITVVFVLLPLLRRMPADSRNRFIARVFPQVFRLASVLALLTLAAGATLNYTITGWRNLAVYISSPRGFYIFLGGVLGLLPALFHFLVESRLESRVQQMATLDGEDSQRIQRFLQVVPRVGLGVILAVFILMMIGRCGFRKMPPLRAKCI